LCTAWAADFYLRFSVRSLSVRRSFSAGLTTSRQASDIWPRGELGRRFTARLRDRIWLAASRNFAVWRSFRCVRELDVAIGSQYPLGYLGWSEPDSNLHAVLLASGHCMRAAHGTTKVDCRARPAPSGRFHVRRIRERRWRMHRPVQPLIRRRPPRNLAASRLRSPPTHGASFAAKNAAELALIRSIRRC
jgi:hypothetical protein